MIDWLPFCVRRDGPLWKTGYPSWPFNFPMRGEVKHSAEGYWPGVYANLDGPRRGSWHFTIGYDRIEQHYPLQAKCWHAADTSDDEGIRANLETWGTEHLGIAGQELSDYQLDTTILLSRVLMQQSGYSAAARVALPGVFAELEHNEVSDEGTSCPSGRIPWGVIMPRLQPGGGDMFVRFNGVASFWGGKVLDPGWYDMRTDIDFPGLPLTAAAVELDVRTDPTFTGRLQVCDGSSAYADELSRLKPQAVVKALPQASRLKFHVLDNKVKIALVGIVGYWQ